MKRKGNIKILLTLIAFVFYLHSAWAQEVNKQTFTYRDTLKLDFYTTVKNIDTARPLLVVVHGGGFSGGNRDSESEVKFARAMAGAGYAVASISYRLTMKGKSFGCDCPAGDKIDTFVAAAEDIADAVLYLHKRSESLRFDSNKTILSGSSAGAEGVLDAVFMRDDYRFRHIPEFPVAGVISMAGAVVNKEYITANNRVPVLFFHGAKDNTVPYGTAAHHYCKPDETGYLILDGPEAMIEKLKEFHDSYIIAFDPEGKHEWSWLAYSHVDLIKQFIEHQVLKGEFEQCVMQLKK
ncbi:MAG: alpha/beta hydrolase [Flavobacteriaceae bacterium]|nr:alpha/beta hydrolase [Flavobacteriaceae bacterium]